MPDLFFLIVGIILALAGFLSIAGIISDAASCRTAVNAEIVSVKKHSTYYKGKTTETYRPTYGYKYEGRDYTSQADEDFRDPEMGSVGKNVVIKINPRKPERVQKKKKAGTVVFGLILSAFGALLIYCYFL